MHLLPPRLCIVFAALAFHLAAATVARTQVTTADVIGQVTDEQGGIVAGAAVSVRSDATNLARTVITNAAGDYAFNLLPIGVYSVQVEMTGFARFARVVQLSAGDRRRVDVVLSIGATSETINVSAVAGVQADSATLATLVPERAVQDLPLNGRNVTGLVRLVPGATEGLPSSLSSGNRPDDRRQTSTVSVNGQNDVVNNNLIDGMDNNERYIGAVAVRPSVDAIAEVRVNRGST